MRESDLNTIPVVVRISSRIIQDGNEERTEIRSEGLMQSTPGRDMITYSEKISEEDEVPVCLTLTERERTEGVEVRIKKSGVIRSEMLFIEGEKTECIYETPMGNLFFDIICRKIDAVKGQAETEIILEYLLTGGGEILSDAIVRILVLAPKDEFC